MFGVSWLVPLLKLSIDQTSLIGSSHRVPRCLVLCVRYSLQTICGNKSYIHLARMLIIFGFSAKRRGSHTHIKSLWIITSYKIFLTYTKKFQKKVKVYKQEIEISRQEIKLFAPISLTSDQTYCHIFDYQLNWKSDKFRFSRWSHIEALFFE